MMDYLLIDRCAKERLLDVNVLREATGGISDYFLVEARMEVGIGLREIENGTCMKEVRKVSELGKLDCLQRYQARLNEEGYRIRVNEARVELIYGSSAKVRG